MVLLQASIHRLKLDFDQKIDDLKIRKKQIVEHVKTVNKRLVEINDELGCEEQLDVPIIDEELEYPENHFQVNDQDVEDYMKRKEEEAALAATKGKKSRKADKSPSPNKLEEDDEEDGVEKKEDLGPIDLETIQALPRKGAKKQTSPNDEELDAIMQIELQYEKD